MAKEKRVVDDELKPQPVINKEPIKPILKARLEKIEKEGLMGHVTQQKKTGFTGLTFSLDFMPSNGFSNYCIVAMFIEDGIVVREDRSQPYNGTEAYSRVVELNRKLLEDLQMNYPAGFQRCG